MNLQQTIINDLITIENDLGNPSFTWNSGSYNFIPSITSFNRELETGGYQVVKLLTATVRKLNASYGNVFTVLPTPQQIIYYPLDGQNYRIESIKQDATGAYFIMIGHATNKGV